jgi:hypothetical protein
MVKGNKETESIHSGAAEYSDEVQSDQSELVDYSLVLHAHFAFLI